MFPPTPEEVQGAFTAEGGIPVPEPKNTLGITPRKGDNAQYDPPNPDAIQARQRNGSPVFYGMLNEMAETHDRKSHDYASNDSPYANYQFAGKLAALFAHSPEDMGFLSRIGEKMYRLANLEKDGKIPSNESMEDTERDLPIIMTLWMSMRRERRMKQAASMQPGTIQKI